MNSFSDDQFNNLKKKENKNMDDNNDKNTSSSSSTSASSISPIGASNIHAQMHGHRQCSSYDTSMIDTSESYDNEVNFFKIMFGLRSIRDL